MLRRTVKPFRLVAAAALLLCGGSGTAARTHPPPAPLTIEAAIARALAMDRQLEYLRLDHTLEEARYRLSIREFLPTIAVAYSGSDSVSYGAPDSRSRRLTLSVQQLVFGGQRRIHSRRLRRTELNIEQLELLAEAERTTVDVIELFIEFLGLKQQNRILHETLELSRQQQSIAAEEFALGTINELQLLEVDLMSRDLALELRQSESEKRQLRAGLAQLLRLDLAATGEPHGSIDGRFRGHIDSRSIERHRARIAAANLDVLRAGHDLALAQEQQRRTRRFRVPDIRLRADVTSAADRFPLSEHGYSVGVSFDFAVPFIPTETTVSAGRQTPAERSRSLSGTLRPGDNIDALLDRSAVEIAVRRSRTRHEEILLKSQTAFDRYAVELEHHRGALEILEARDEVETRRTEIERLRLQLGEITPVAYLEAEVARARLRIAITHSVVALFRTEVAILRLSGAGTFEPAYRRLITTGERR
ncbi:MAG: hypothetical protein EA384_07640 [Spirochaetaceae bacterium]|nr:MAG: hypothetical protein EA384_07640 [Spirochaetaceae bacterium]